MTQEPAPTQPPVVLAGAPVTGAPIAGATRPLSLALPGRVSANRLLRELAAHPRAGVWALRAMVIGTFLVVAYATARENAIVPRAYLAFPPWDSGPLHPIFRWLPVKELAINIGFSTMVVLLVGVWLVAVAAVRTLSLRAIVLSILALHAIVLLAP